MVIFNGQHSHRCLTGAFLLELLLCYKKITNRYTYTVDVLIAINGQVTIILLNDL